MSAIRKMQLDQAESYSRWLLESVGVDAAGLHPIKFHDCGDTGDFSSVKGLTFADGDYEVTAIIPSPSMKAYQARIDAAIGPKKSRSKRGFIKCRGITVKKTWNWTAQREKEVRACIRDFSNPDWGHVRKHLHGSPWRAYRSDDSGVKATMARYAANPL